VPETDVRLFGKPESFAMRRMGVAISTAEDVVTARKRATEAASYVHVSGRPVDRVILPEPFNVFPSISDDADLVVIGNPTNPTGVLWRPDDLLGLDDGWRFVVVDEAFIDVVGEEHSVIPQVPTHPRLIVLRSLTKTWAIAGLRVGYMVADPDIVLGPLRLARPLRAGSSRRPEPRPGPHPLPEADGPRHCPAPMRHIPWVRMELFPARRPKKTAGRFPHHRT